MDPIDQVNQLLDALPRTRFGRLGRDAPAFRSCGIAGFYLAVVVTLSTGAARGRSLAVLAALAALCGASFFAYAHVRRRISGAERLVLLEHVWFALLCSAGALVAAGEAPLGFLDSVVSGLAFFLAAGRLGCALAGCCHGFPSSIGLRYGPEHVREGFPARWLGVRLFPVQILEGAALAGIGVGSVLFALLGQDGTALCFFLVAYAIVRFGLEGLRGDERPHLLGVSQARWMAVAEVATAIAVAERSRAHPWALGVLGGCAAVWLVRAAYLSRSGPAARALRPDHLALLREAARAAPPPPGAAPRSPLGFGVAASPSPRGVVVSLSGARAALDLPLLCRVAAGAFPEVDPATALLGRGGVLLFEVPGRLQDPAPAPRPDLWKHLHAQVARARALVAPSPEGVSTPEAAPPEQGAPNPVRALRRGAAGVPAARVAYFAPLPPPVQPPGAA